MASAAVTVVGVSCQAGLDHGEGAPALCSPLEIPGIGTAPNTSDVSQGEGRSETTLGPAVCRVRRRCPDDRTRRGGSRTLEKRVEAAAPRRGL